MERTPLCVQSGAVHVESGPARRWKVDQFDWKVEQLGGKETSLSGKWTRGVAQQSLCS